MSKRDFAKRNLTGFVVAAFTSMAIAGSAEAATIVNCIGEQTTITGEAVTGATDLWPQQLGMLLGATYTVNNDGVNAGTVVAGTAKSAASLAGPPGIVIIGPYAEHDYMAGLTLATWQADYKKLVDAYLALTPAPTVYVMTPPPAAFTYQSAAEQTFATDVVKPAVLAVAAGGNTAGKTLKVIDLFSDAALATAADMAGDGHFKPAGHKDVADLAYKCVAMGMCGAGTTTGAGGAAGGTAGAGGGGGTGGAAGAGGATAGTSGATAGTSGATAGTSGATAGAGGSTAGTSGATAGAGGSSTGAAGTSGATAGTGGGAAGTGGSTTGTAGTGGSTTGAAGSSTGGAGTGAPERSSSGGGCAVGGRSTTGALASLLLALALAAPAWRRRRR